MSRARTRWIAVAALCGAIYAIPRVFEPERFRSSIRAGLEQALGRKVEINGEIAYLAVPRPGFSVSNVVIHEHPSVGSEPFAYVEELRFHVALSGLPRGRVELAGVRLDSPHINLMRLGDAGWNFQPFLDHALGPKSGAGTLAAIEVREGRLNFKSGDTKSVFYLDATDLTVEAANPPDHFSIRFEGEPARTDRHSRAMGRLSGRGMLIAGGTSGAESRIEIGLTGTRTSISELVTLAEGRAIGLGGFVTSRLKLSGPLSAVELEGELELDEFDRFGWLLPGASGWKLPVRGRADVPGQSVTLETKWPAGKPLPLSVRAKASRLLGRPSWAVLLTANEAPLASLRSLLAETGFPLPGGLAAEGTVSGAIGFSSERGAQGELQARDAVLPVAGLEQPVRMDTASVAVSGGNFSLAPTVMRIGENRTATVEGRLLASTGDREVKLATGGLEFELLRPLWRVLAEVPLPGILDTAGSGSLNGSLRWARTGGDRPDWSGEFAINGATSTVEGLPGPLRVDSALISMRGEALVARRVSASLGRMALEGSYSYRPGAKFPHEFDANAGELDLAAFETLLAPAFERRQGLFARTLGRAAPVPEWLSARRAAGSIRVRKLRVGGAVVENASARVEWEGPRLTVRDWRGSLEQGALQGRLTVDLAGREPAYRGRFEVKGAVWQGGRVDADAGLETSGAGVRALERLKLDGSFVARDVALPGGVEWRPAGGSFAYTGPGRLRLTGVEASIAGETYQGQGGSGPDGRLTLDLTGPEKQIRLVGRIDGLRFDLAPLR